MRALTVKAPWAWAIIHGGKEVENRTWVTSYRGPLAIHASAGCARKYYEWGRDWMGAIDVQTPALDTLPRGCVIGTVELLDCVRDASSLWAMPDSWHWILSAPKPCQPRFVRGSLGLWTLDT